MQVTGSGVDCQSESVRQESNNHAMDKDRESSTTTKTESSSSSNESTNRTKEVVTEIAESAEKVESVDTGEASVDECDGECKAEGEGEREEEGEGMEMEEKGEDRSAAGMETDVQREVEGASKTDGRTSIEKDKVHT